MTETPPPHAFTRFLLHLAITIPFIYYGIQLLAAPFFPHFSFIRNTASELGASLAPHPRIFNIGIMMLGIITFLAAVGFLRALRQLRVEPLFTFLTFLALLINGFQSLWAGLHPIPDPRHAGHLPVMIAMTLLPFLLTLTMWRQTNSRLAHNYFLATCLLLLAIAPMMSGMGGLDTHNYRGLIQRVFTFTVFPPIAVAAHILSRRLSMSKRVL
jgi:hypothetical membrane protein